MGGSGENPGQPDRSACRSRPLLLDLCLRAGTGADSGAAQKHLRRRRNLFGSYAHARNAATALVQHRHSAAQATAASPAGTVASRSGSRPHHETFGNAVLSNLSCGVLVFGVNGLVNTSNPAAKAILGFASTTGMSADDIFRGAVISRGPASQAGAFDDETAASNDPVCVADEVDVVLREGSNRRQVEAEYETPAGDKRFLAVTVSPVALQRMAACLALPASSTIAANSERIRRQQELQGRSFRRDGVAVAHFPDHDFRLRPAVGEPAGSGTGQATCHRYRRRSRPTRPQPGRTFDRKACFTKRGRGCGDRRFRKSSSY